MKYSNLSKALGIFGLAVGFPYFIVGVSYLVIYLDENKILETKFSVSFFILIIASFSYVVIKHGYKKK